MGSASVHRDMISMRIDHVIQADTVTYWRWFFDDVPAREFFLEGLRYLQFDILERTEDEHTIRRVVQCQPRVTLPAPIRLVFRKGFRYREEGVFDKPSGPFRFAWIPERMSDRIVLEGSTRTVDRPGEPGTCDRLTEMTVGARFPGLAGPLERHTARVLREQWDESARVSNEWLTARKSA